MLFACAATTAVEAADLPLTAQRLHLRRHGSRAALRFVTRDPGLPFPPFGSVDDPAVGVPGGLLMELLSPAEGIVALAVPAGEGDPGWERRALAIPLFRFRNGLAPGGPSAVYRVHLREGRALRVSARTTGLLLERAQGAVGVRVTIGGTRACARFAGAAVQRDTAGVFRGRDATAAGLTNCSDAALLGTACDASGFPECGGTCPGDGVCLPGFGTCHCVSPTGPCGDTSPLCSGACPAGETCVATDGGLLPSCGCLPVGATPCGTPGVPVCGGECPAGLVCHVVFTGSGFGSEPVCACTLPGPCHTGGGACGPGTGCAATPWLACFPILCGGEEPYPVCGGPCFDGGECSPVSVAAGSVTLCICAPPVPCDTCGGFVCPAGGVCAIDMNGPTCACASP
jgi:hypothetical protein